MPSHNAHTHCQLCNKSFKHQAALKQHKAQSSAHNTVVCDICQKTFDTQDALKDHCAASPMHPFCAHCGIQFDTGFEQQAHYLSNHTFCPLCRQFFDSDDSRDGHDCQSCWYCVDCMRFFQQEQHLNTHLRASKLHNKLSHECLGPRCTKAFVSGSDRMQHLESGACRSGMDRASVNKLAIQLDSAGILTNPDRLLTTSSDPPSVPGPTTTLEVMEVFDGTAYECTLCHRTFLTLPRLNAHLMSPAHDPKIYHCPTVHDGDEAEFKTLSGLLQHAESECCDVQKNQASQTLDILTARMGRITL